MTEEEIYRRAVYELQVFLTAARVLYPQLPELYADGIYGVQTREAVAAFQEVSGLSVTGEADQATWEAAREAYFQALLRTAAPQPAEWFTQTDSIPESGDPVYVVQVMLRAIGQRYRQFSGVHVTGTLDRETQQALESLWTVVDILPQEDFTSAETLRLLSRLYNAARQEPAE